MSASVALQKAVIAALRSASAVTSLVGQRSYDVPPSGAQKPYISLGPTSFITERQNCFKRRTETIQIDVWTGDQERRAPCKTICDAIVVLFDENQAALSLDDPYALGRMDLVLARIMDDPDGITKHGVLQFECEVQTIS